MPGVTLHFVTAHSVLERWKNTSGARPPFDLDDPAALNAFYHGAVGPDLGYFPGGDRVLSDLAHCVRTGTLARSLVQGARTSRERAFAWGWVSHVLADRDVHPWIGLGVGALVYGPDGGFVDGATNPRAHLRVEMGVDAWFAERRPELCRRRLAPLFDNRNVGLLVRAYARAYGVAIDPRRFLRSHRSTCLRVGQALSSVGVLGALMAGGGLAAVSRWALRTAYTNGARTISLAYFNPVPPADWLLEGIERAVDGHADEMMAVYTDGAAGLADYNLDTGRLLATERDHPGTRRALEGLAELAEATRPQRPPLRGPRAVRDAQRPATCPLEA